LEIKALPNMKAAFEKPDLRWCFTPNQSERGLARRRGRDL
jgi:hypothetical protein